jgi:dihydrolipoamide dehydrogenase
MSEIPYKVVIIGGGPGGYVAAIRAAQLGMNAILVEREALGGVCLNWGCIPTKALLRNAEVARLLQNGGREYGFEVEGLSLDYAAAVKRSRKISSRLVKGVELLMREYNVEVMRGTGRLASASEVEVTLEDGPTQTVEADAIILATGAHPFVLPRMEVDGERVLTAREAITRRELPASAVIVGAGPIGLEFATVWSSYGSDVTVVEMLDHPLPAEDAEAAGELGRYLRRQKIDVRTSTRVEAIEPSDGGVRVTVTGADGEEETLEAEVALLAAGVRPNSEGLGLEEVGVETKRGWVQVDSYMRTSVPNVYAVGDVNGLLPLAHVASAQGILAVETIAGSDRRPFDVQAMPRGTYTSPQVASFGLSEAQAREEGYEVQLGKFPFLANGKALAIGENHGFVKIVADASTGEILGAVIVGPEATELLPEIVLAHDQELTPEEIAYAVHAHPTLNEAVMEAAHDVFGKPLHSI